MEKELILLFLHIFLVSFFLNLLWEMAHSVLYETCLRAPLKKYIPLIISASLKDGFWITFFYGVTVTVTRQKNILTDPVATVMFLLLTFGFAFADEKISIRMKRWTYTASMPTLFGVGLTPLLELAATGLIAVWYVMNR